MTTRRTGERGAALLTVMVAVTVLTALAVDLAYSSRVSLQIAANARDELRASYLARSGVALSRLVLSFQQQIDQSMPGAGAAAGALPGAAAGTPAPAAGALAAGLSALGGIPRIQIWNLVPVGSSLAEGLFPPSGAPAAPAARGAAGEGGAKGPSFDARIDDEGRKVNAQLDGYAQTGDTKLWQKVQSLYQLVCDARWDPVFDRGDRGERLTREDLLVRMRDWVNEGERSSELAVAGGSGASCGMIPAQQPFADAFGDKNQPYDRGDERYRTKNARMDSLDELYLVAGVGDAFMAAFGDSLTVYLKREDKRNVNELDKRGLVGLAAIMAEPKGQPALLDPEFASRLQKAVLERTLGGILSITATDLAGLIEREGVKVSPALAATGPNSPFTDRSTTFRIHASGSAGAVQSSIDAVVRLGEQPQAGEQIAMPGRIIHWREE